MNRRAGHPHHRKAAPRNHAAPYACRLVVMVKAPVGGRVKTRLARGAGLSSALRFYRHATRALLTRLAADPRWQTILAVAPDTAITSRAWPADLCRFAQRGGDLGQRMQRIMDTMPPGPVVIIGSDIPGVSRSHIATAFRSLGRHDAVFGPAVDGGYWLVGLARRRRIPRTFMNVRWSSADTLSDTLANLSQLAVGQVATLNDVDDGTDLAQCGVNAGRCILPVRGAFASMRQCR